MILVDTSIWVDHLRQGDKQLAVLLEGNAVVMHPYVVGEFACGSLSNRRAIIGLLESLPTTVIASKSEVLDFIERHALHGRGIGYVDIHLLAAAALTGDTKIWTNDKMLDTAASSLRLAYRQQAAH